MVLIGPIAETSLPPPRWVGVEHRKRAAHSIERRHIRKRTCEASSAFTVGRSIALIDFSRRQRQSFFFAGSRRQELNDSALAAITSLASIQLGNFPSCLKSGPHRGHRLVVSPESRGHGSSARGRHGP